MNRAELNKASIDNLCDFWKSTGCLLMDYTGKGNISGYINISKTWPNRYWIDWDGLPEHLPQFFDNSHWAVCNGGILTPAWGADEATRLMIENELIERGYKFRFRQSQMFLNMSKYTSLEESEMTSRIRLSKASTTEEIKIFCDVCGCAFNYYIDYEAMFSSAQNANCHIMVAYNKDEKPVATAVLFQTANIVGVHQVGVSHSYRRQGIARELMNQLLALGNKLLFKYQANQQDTHMMEQEGSEAQVTPVQGYMTLQAGDAAKELYTSLGFEEQFVYNNFSKDLSET